MKNQLLTDCYCQIVFIRTKIKLSGLEKSKIPCRIQLWFRQSLRNADKIAYKSHPIFSVLHWLWTPRLNHISDTLDPLGYLVQNIFLLLLKDASFFLSFFHWCCQNSFQFSAEYSRGHIEFPVLATLTQCSVLHHHRPTNTRAFVAGGKHILLHYRESHSDQGVVLVGNILGVVVNVQRHTSITAVSHWIFYSPE